MPSKQMMAKYNQCYTDKFSPMCATCKHFRSEMVKTGETFSGEPWMEEKNKRCDLGGFAVKKSAWCLKFERSPAHA